MTVQLGCTAWEYTGQPMSLLLLQLFVDLDDHFVHFINLQDAHTHVHAYDRHGSFTDGHSSVYEHSKLW